jgi:uncharacterized protein YeaO (DUF488 family)
MLYTASYSAVKKFERKMKRYYVMGGRGNDEVAPDQSDFDLYNSGDLTWQGFMINYQVKLRQQEAYNWMRRVSFEAVHEDIVLVDSEEDAQHSLRVQLAEMMASMFSGQMNFHYSGELK